MKEILASFRDTRSPVSPFKNLYLLRRDTFNNQNTCLCAICVCEVHLLDRYFRKTVPNTIFTRIYPKNIRIFLHIYTYICIYIIYRHTHTHGLERRWKFNIRLKRSCAEGSAIFIFHSLWWMTMKILFRWKFGIF